MALLTAVVASANTRAYGATTPSAEAESRFNQAAANSMEKNSNIRSNTIWNTVFDGNQWLNTLIKTRPCDFQSGLRAQRDVFDVLRQTAQQVDFRCSQAASCGLSFRAASQDPLPMMRQDIASAILQP